MEHNFETLGDYLEKYNPFALKNSKNEILHFPTYSDIYLHTMKEMRMYCKRGYVELALLVKYLTGFNDETCTELADNMKKLNRDLSNEPLLIDWSRVGYEKEKLVAILNGLHDLTETEFDWAQFEKSWLTFRSWNDEYTEEQSED